MLIISAFSISNVLEPTKEKENGISLQVTPVNGGIEGGEKAIHLPSGKGLRIKTVRPMYGDDSIILVKGIPREKLRSKDLLISAATGCVISNRGIFLSQKIVPLGDDYIFTGFMDEKTPPPGPEVEAKIDSKSGCYTIRFSRRVAIIPGKSYTLTNQQGITVSLTALLPDFPYDNERTSFLAALPKEKTSLEVKDYLYIHMKTKGYALIPPGYENKDFPGTKKIGQVIFTPKYYGIIMTIIERRAKSQGGLSIRDFFRVVEIPPYILDIILDHLIFTGLYRKEKEYLLANEGTELQNLSPMAQNLLGKIKQRGIEGLPVGAAKSDAEKKIYADLVRMGLIFSENEIFLSMEALKTISDKIDETLKESDKPLILTELAKKTGIARKVIFTVIKHRENAKSIAKENDTKKNEEKEKQGKEKS